MKKSVREWIKLYVATFLCGGLPGASFAQYQEKDGLGPAVAISSGSKANAAFRGRIAVSSDGNVHDTDDFGATALSLALLDAAGLHAKLVHYDFSNHILTAGQDLSYEGVKWTLAQRKAEMRESALGGAERFGFNKSKFFDDMDNVAGAVDNMAAEIDKSSGSDPLFIIAAGPMEVIWRGVNKSQQSKRQFVTVISHHWWNEGHKHSEGMSHDWDDVMGLGVKSVKIGDQNVGLKKAFSAYNFLKESPNPNWKWLYQRMEAAKLKSADPSDAGMAYWLVTGGSAGGDEKADPEKIKVFLSNKQPTVFNGSFQRETRTDIMPGSKVFLIDGRRQFLNPDQTSKTMRSIGFKK